MSLDAIVGCVLSVCVLLWVVGPVGAYGQRVPPYDLRVQIEENVVTLRLRDKSTGRERGTASGFVVRDDPDEVTIATAEHVVASARELEDVVLEARFYGRDIWVDTRLLPGLPGEDLDVALLRVDRNATPFGRSDRVGSLLLQAPGDVGDSLWALGYSLDRGGMAWRAGAPADARHGHFLFDAVGVAGGYSGGVVVNEVGPIAMITNAGSGGRGHVAVPFATLESLADIDFGFAENRALDALRYSHEKGLGVSMRVVDYHVNQQGGEFWIGIRLEEQRGGEFIGRAVTRANDVEVRLRPDRSGVVVSFAEPARSGAYALLPALEMSFEEEHLEMREGFVVLGSSEVDRRRAYLAIPEVGSGKEDLVTRALLGGPGEENVAQSLSNDFKRSIATEGRVLLSNAVYHPFAITLDKGFERVRFRLPAASVQGGPVSVSGVLLAPDKGIDNQVAWTKRVGNTRCHVVARGAGGEEVRLGEGAQLDPGEPFGFTFEPRGGLLHLVWGHGTWGGYDWAMVNDLTIRYDALR